MIIDKGTATTAPLVPVDTESPLENTVRNTGETTTFRSSEESEPTGIISENLIQDGSIMAIDSSSLSTGNPISDTPDPNPDQLLLASAHVFLFPHAMRRRRKKFFVPFPSWTPIVVGLSSDGSDFCSDTSDLGDSAPLETLEEEIEMNSEEERCPSSKGESAASEASNFDAATELDEEGTDLAPISDFPHGPDILGLPDPCIPFDLAAILCSGLPLTSQSLRFLGRVLLPPVMLNLFH
ncbi:hypothetical protein Dimus_036973 [Dionaea muscipula]